MENLITIKDRAISCVAGESEKEFNEAITENVKIVRKICDDFKTEKLMVLNIVLREMMKLKPKQKIGFDFGGKKEFELRRLK